VTGDRDPAGCGCVIWEGVMAFVTLVDRINRALGVAAGWCALAMMLAQVFSVVARYVFGYGLIAVQEVVIYGHAIMFLLGAGFVLRENGHVRVDVFHAQYSDRTRRIVDLIGLLVFVLPVAGVILWVGVPYAARAWSTFEGSRQAGGLPVVYLLKTVIVVFAVSVAAQAAAIATRLWIGAPDAHWARGGAHG